MYTRRKSTRNGGAIIFAPDVIIYFPYLNAQTIDITCIFDEKVLYF